MEKNKNSSSAFLAILITMICIPLLGMLINTQIHKIDDKIHEQLPTYKMLTHVEAINASNLKTTYLLDKKNAFLSKPYYYGISYHPTQDIKFAIDVLEKVDDSHFIKLNDRTLVDDAYVKKQYIQFLSFEDHKFESLTDEMKSWFSGEFSDSYVVVSAIFPSDENDQLELKKYLLDETYWIHAGKIITQYTYNPNSGVDMMWFM